MKDDRGRIRLRAEHVAWREIDGQTVLLDLRTSTYLAANESAGLLWKALAEGTTRDELVQALASAYELPEDQAERDVEEFLSNCRDRDLVIDEAA